MTLKEALIKQGNNSEEADNIIQSMKEDIENGANPEELLHDQGLEPDYVMDLLD